MIFFVVISFMTINAQDSFSFDNDLKQANQNSINQTGDSTIKFRSLFEFGFLGSKLFEEYPIFSLVSANGVQFGDVFFAGVGSGIEFFDFHTVPVYLDLRYKIIQNGNLSPFIYANAGYSFPVGKRDFEDDLTGGQLYCIGGGFTGTTLKGRQFIFSIGYRYQFLEREYSEQWGGATIEEKLSYRRAFVKFGWFFN